MELVIMQNLRGIEKCLRWKQSTCILESRKTSNRQYIAIFQGTGKHQT